jgi:hypothetical protein
MHSECARPQAQRLPYKQRPESAKSFSSEFVAVAEDTIPHTENMP